MLLEFFITYLHYLSIILVVAGVLIELFLVKSVVTAENLSRIVKADGLYGIFSIVLVGSGLMRALMFGKGSDYYFSNWIFNLKFSLFVVVGLLSIIPTITFLKLNKQQKKTPTATVEIPKFQRIIWMIRLELIILLIIPFLAILMANNIGL